MNLLKTEDSILSTSALTVISCLPFMAVGMLGSNTAIWIAYTLGGVALLVFLARLCAIISNKAVATQSQKIDRGAKFLFGFAIPMGVSAAIIEQAESDMATECYIFAALMLLVSIAMMFAPEKK
ncbi:MAG: hypothetical protein UH625_09995 [Muribaculaceae bacterium]|nr:hypothetical protein [Muribaculaceae bacterium]